ncbi:phospholipase effector Tle1 domain-containing protein [Xanthomonas fragariae]|uniref:phospholipase effector Tle1 domain-containing protein n=1 Tax=Xanthomonas fragariae TaxID=48664 RepID=UPI0022AB2E45|nr:DUF2235 domain-containing protein [Xanthomonas fragariae]WAT16016.1 DUF2235 domain-containing protein [Xanthomonas fragariae]
MASSPGSMQWAVIAILQRPGPMAWQPIRQLREIWLLLVSQQNPHTRLFVACFDGTGNDKYKDTEHITNIGILDNQVQTAKSNNVKNIGGYYVPGVGTQDDTLNRSLDGAVGYSYGSRIEEG